MAQNPVRTAAAATGGLVTGTLLETIVKRFGYVLNVGETLSGLDFDTGEPPLLVHFATTGFDYYLDTTDTTTVDDGLTCLVSGNGLRYHIEDAASISRNAVIEFASVDPGAPVVGDAYIVDTAATGAFSGHDDDIAVYTRRGWIFATPDIGLTVYNEATETNWQFVAAGWTGFAFEIADSSVRPESLLKALGIAVESTLNTPPGSPAANTYWLVGTSPTGAFVGHNGDIAYYKASTWQFIDAYEGATIFHKTFGYELFYVSGTWLGGSGSTVQTFSTAGGATWTKPGVGSMALVEVWAGGGSGGRAGTGDAGGGGGGGAYVSAIIPLSALASTEAVTIGAGGPAATVDNGDGTAGGNSSFGSWLTAYGGGPGAGNVQTSGGAGGGGGQGGAGVAGVSGAGTVTAGGAGGSDRLGNAGPAGGNTGSAAATTLNGTGGGGGGGTGGNGGAAFDGGGGGGGGRDSDVPGNGGNSFRGGAGGAGARCGSGTTLGVAGTSTFGGNGGQGATGSNNASAGAQPGGGGGGSVTGNSGKGGDGMVRVTVF